MEFAWPATPSYIQAYKVYAEEPRQFPGIQRAVQGCEAQGLIPRDVLSGNEDHKDLFWVSSNTTTTKIKSL